MIQLYLNHPRLAGWEPATAAQVTGTLLTLRLFRPCSVHDPEQAITYAKKLVEYAKEAEDDLMIVMRVYFEK
jgi:phospho-2-dehydro-3-deoxyheptonate aldolase